MFAKATKRKSKLRCALVGPSGSGKTYTALLMAQPLAGDGRIAVIDTEQGSASLYAGDVADFDVVELPSYEPRRYVEAINAAADAGYPVLVIDSLSHAWSGTGGALDQVDKRAGNPAGKFGAWRDVTPMHHALVDAVLSYPGHVIATMRAKTAYEIQENEKGKKVPVKLGLAPIQRNGVEYEFTVVGDIDHRHVMTVSKSRCPSLADQVIREPGASVAEELLAWLDDGEDRPAIQALALIREGRVDEAKALAGEHKATMRRDEIRRVATALNAALADAGLPDQPDVSTGHDAEEDAEAYHSGEAAE